MESNLTKEQREHIRNSATHPEREMKLSACEDGVMNSHSIPKSLRHGVTDEAQSDSVQSS